MIENKLIIEILGYTNIGLMIGAGLLIVNNKKRIKLIGLTCYYLLIGLQILFVKIILWRK